MNEQHDRDFRRVIGGLAVLAMAVRLGGFRPTPEQAIELAQGIQYLGAQLKKQRETPAVEQPRPPSVIQQGVDQTADFLRAINNPTTQVINKD